MESGIYHVTFFLRQSLSVAQANSALLCSQEVALLETHRCGSFCVWCRVSHILGLCSTSESRLSGKSCRVVCLGMHLGPQSQSLTSGTLHRYRRTSPTYWITVTPCCRQSAQKREAENLGARTQVAPGRGKNKWSCSMLLRESMWLPGRGISKAK